MLSQPMSPNPNPYTTQHIHPTHNHVYIKKQIQTYPIIFDLNPHTYMPERIVFLIS